MEAIRSPMPADVGLGSGFLPQAVPRPTSITQSDLFSNLKPRISAEEEANRYLHDTQGQARGPVPAQCLRL